MRAITRIGQISAELETSPQANGGSRHPNSGKPTKTEVLKAAGISTSAANRAEKLAAHSDAVESYIAKKAAQGKPVVITEALTAVQAAAREQKAADALRKSFERSKMRSQPRI